VVFACAALTVMDQAALNRELTVHVHSHVFTYEIIKKGGSAGEIAVMLTFS
jgi:hypothetical protein